MKKAQAAQNQVIYAALVIIVIAIVGILIYQFFLSPNAAPKTFFKNIAKSLGISTAGETKYTDFAARVANIRSKAEADAIITEINNELQTTQDQSLINRYVNLKHEAEGMRDLITTEEEFASPPYNYDGGDIPSFQSKLESIRLKFDTIARNYPNTATGLRAQGNVNLIDKIKDCEKLDADSAECLYTKSHNFCVLWIDEDNRHHCGFANCEKATGKNANYCQNINLIKDNGKPRCVASTNDRTLPGEYVICKSCLNIAKCEDYGLKVLGETNDACNSNACGDMNCFSVGMAVRDSKFRWKPGNSCVSCGLIKDCSSFNDYSDYTPYDCIATIKDKCGLSCKWGTPPGVLGPLKTPICMPA